MSHDNTLSILFKEFAQCLNNTSLECASSNYKLETYAKARIILGRLYYACFHKGLEDFALIRNSTAGKKHSKLLTELRTSSNADHQKLYLLISKLYDLRIWADYDYTDEIYKNANPSNLGYYMYQANQII